MGPIPRADQQNNRGDGDEYERDGWYIGYEVEMDGVGMVNVYEERDDSSCSDGYDGPGDGSDDEFAARRAGYTAVPSAPTSDAEGDDNSGSSEVQQPSQSTSFALAPVQKEFAKALEAAADVHLKDSDFHIASGSSRITLTEEKVGEIKRLMGSFSLKPPEWADGSTDDKIFAFINKDSTPSDK